jgi:hypothetical protein
MAKSVFLLENIMTVFKVLTFLFLKIYSEVQLQAKGLFKITQSKSNDISCFSRKVEELKNYLRGMQERKGLV